MANNIISYKASNTAKLFHRDNSFVRGIRGPFGSGKSVGCCFEIFLRAKAQEPCKDGIRKSRWIIARNTQPQLETTTIKTWLDWFPENVFGKMNRKPPFTHHVKFGDVELEVIFLALDKPEDVKKLLSFEVTGIWFNEAREIEYDLVSGATGRVGRYPSKKDKPDSVADNKWPTWCGIIMDTNPPDDEHWWFKAAEEDKWAYDDDGHLHPNFIKYETIENIPERYRWSFYAQPSGLSKDAENIENLPGGTDYYVKQIAGKTKEWINVYVNGNYGQIVTGQPVYGSAYNADLHKLRDTPPIRQSGMIHVGIDSSGRHPAAVFLQRTPSSHLQVVHEFCVTADEGMGAVAFARALKGEMLTKFPGLEFDIWGDPAGAWKSQNDESTYFDILRGQGIFAKGSPGLRIPDRVETVIHTLNQVVEGKALLQISPACKILIRGFEGGYRYRRLNVSGSSRFDDKPEKNRFSDIQDALQYVLCGMGQYRKTLGRDGQSVRKTVIAKSKYKI